MGWTPRPPLTEAVLLNSFLVGLHLGLTEGGPGGFLLILAACLLRAGFYALLRPGELLKAVVADFVLQPQLNGSHVGVFVTREPMRDTLDEHNSPS